MISSADEISIEEPSLAEQEIAAIRFREQAARIAATLTDAELAAQCLLAALDNRAYLTEAQKYLLRETPVGSVMLFRYNLTGTKDEVRTFLTELSSFVIDICGIPPFVAVDHEGGQVHRFGADVERLPPPFSFWEMAEEQGEEIALTALEDSTRLSAEELRDLGVTLNLAPVAEVLNTDNQRFLETRSYGPDPVFVEKAASAFVRAMDDSGVASAIKHFPGSSAEDPHFAVSIISGDRDELDSMVDPFRNIIKNRYPAAVMVSHSIVPAIDPNNNASLSHNVISSWLRDELGFTGIVIADDFTMQAISANNISAEQATIIALNAGVDMIMCWPYNMIAIHRAIVSAVQDGRLERERLLDAAEHVLAEKIRYGLISVEQLLVENYNTPAGVEYE